MSRRRLSAGATFAAVGVVFGDIGTSPLYALQQSLAATGGDAHSSATILGVLSLMFWSLLVVVTLKYVVLIMRADNDGEGGILSLFALVQRKLEDMPRWGRAVIALAVLGAALFYCDALITPAITVLGAVEGLELLNPGMAHAVVPLTLAIIVLLFAIQHRSTERILQTSANEHGQVFVPVVNAMVFVCVCVFVIGFGSSDALGGTYGAAVACTMSIDTILIMVLASSRWGWSIASVTLGCGLLLLFDLMYSVANLAKFAQGAWLPLLLAAILFGVFMTWRSGRQLMHAALRQMAVPLKELPRLFETATRVPGTAIFLVSEPRYLPTALLRSIEHYHVVHERVVFLNMEVVRTPRQDPGDRVRIETLQDNVYLVTARFGFMETPDVSTALKQCRVRGLKLFGQDCSFFLGWHLVRPRPRGGYEGARRRMFAWMQRRSTQAVEFFHMPDKRVIVLATQVEL